MTFADIPPPSFWNAPSGSTILLAKIVIALLLGIGLIMSMTRVAVPTRRLLTGGLTFVSGLFYVLFFLWPKPINRQPNEMPSGISERVGFLLSDAAPVVGDFSNILVAFMLGLGAYSLIRMHTSRLVRRRPDWQYSLVLLLSALAMVIFGYLDWRVRKFGEAGPLLDLPANWTAVNYVYNFLFDGLFQQMESAMFSIISFYILSAAYRAFRIRSVEATILLATALIFMLGLMGVVAMIWDTAVGHLPAQSVTSSLTLTEISGWLRNSVQTPAIRAIDLGIGLGALAMGLRLWLGIERQGGMS